MIALVAAVLASAATANSSPAPDAAISAVPEPVPSALQAALRAAVSNPAARLEIRSFRDRLPPGCRASRAEVPRPIETSGRQHVKLIGTTSEGFACEGWAFADVKLMAPAWITTRAVRAGEPLDGASREDLRELEPGRRILHELPPGARASRDLAAGVALEPGQIGGAIAPGEPLTVLLRRDGLTIETRGRAIACGPGRACAQLSSGKRLEGRLEGETLVMEDP
ncbi:hypothetical protein [Vulgatibacter incomptus]|uniref:Flagella basal body P-ring formation protein FlgA n=1 Tax=Vulgatibacter incomptus TaxID=1391653 RepID=A0A0K1PHL4_9BACT|nr:hypothetical protein [Vulgatibacter incomptus]AKU93002.1 hypothetical protein AKJ08_3389 [Vulgatibacter incomptus]